MYKKIKKYIEISPREFRGMIVFVVILFSVYGGPYVYEKVMGQPLKITVETLIPKIADIESFDEKRDGFYTEKEEPVTGELFEFNPNDLPIAEWKRLGLTEKQALSIKKYEAKGGKFRTLADVKKMYPITDEMYHRLEPYIKIPKETQNFKSYTENEAKIAFKKRAAVNIELNSADSAELVSISGVGPSFASRIIKYRNKLGGFVSLNQLKEIYGIDSLKFEQIKLQVNIDAKNIQQMDINRCSLNDIKFFPYLRYKQANAIIAYRMQHGNFSDATDLNKIAILSPELIQKITPYFKFQ